MPYRVFISEDPIGFDGEDVNFFAYVENDPLNWIDPEGLLKGKPGKVKPKKKKPPKKKPDEDDWGDDFGGGWRYDFKQVCVQWYCQNDPCHNKQGPQLTNPGYKPNCFCTKWKTVYEKTPYE